MKKIASLKKLQQENPNGLLPIGETIPFTEYAVKHYSCGPIEKGWEIFRTKQLRSDGKDFYMYPESSKNSLNTLFTVKNESGGDLLVVFVADINKNGRVQSTLILTDAAWQEILASNQRVLRVEQVYLHNLEKQIQMLA